MKVSRGGMFVERVLDLYKRGLPPGSSTGWPNVDRFYTVAAGQFSIVTGIPNHGKSSWLDALLVNLLQSPCNGRPWKFFVCSPEQQPTELHISELLERYIGSRFRAGGTMRMSQDEIADAIAAVLDSRFEFAEMDIADEFSDVLTAAHEFAMRCKDSGHQAGIVLDPWNRLEHRRPTHQSETEYISDALTQIVNLTRQTGAHMWLVAHPRQLQADRNTGMRPVPTAYDISGSAHFANKSDNIVVIWRDMAAAHQNLPTATTTCVYVQKVRWKHIGRVGMVQLRYEPNSGRYLDVIEARIERGIEA
jgi:twinkle protein